MAIDRTGVGLRVGPIVTRYDWRDVALYALALGAGENDLRYVLDQPPPVVLPTYGVLPAFAPMLEALQKLGGDLVQLLHTAQRTELVRPWPSAGEAHTTAVVK